MPAQSNIVIADDKPTPVNHTFVPNGRPPYDGGHLAIWKVAGSTLLEDKVLKVLLRDSGTKLKSRISLEIPVVATEVINGVSRPTLVRVEIGAVELTHDRGSTVQEREDTLVMLGNACLNAAIKTAVSNREVFSG